MVAPWISASFPIIRIIMIVLLMLLAVAIVVSIFLQPAMADGAGAITGQSSDTYYSKHKEKNFQGLMKKLTAIFSISAAVISILFFVTLHIFPIPPIFG